jgi:3D (Asp-Asp-Asp) domain-containing protein
MYFLCIIFLFNACNISTVTPFHALATEVVKDNNLEMVHKDSIKLNEIPIQMQYENIKLELALLNKEQPKDNKEEETRNKPEHREFILTFYTSLISENSSAGPVTCQNKPLVPGGVANNVIPQNTKIYLEGYGEVIVNDKGSDKYFGVDNRLDVYIPREPGESDRQYLRRVNNLGVQKVQGYIIK